MKVALSAGHGNLFFLASAASILPVLHSYTSSFYYTGSLARLLDAAHASRLLDDSSWLKARQQCRPELDSKARCVVDAELLYRVTTAVARGPAAHLSAASFAANLRYYSWRTRSAGVDADVFHVRSGFGGPALRRAQQSGAVGLVDHSIADSTNLFSVQMQEAPHMLRSRRPRQQPNGAFGPVNDDLGAADHIVVNSDYVKETLIGAGRAPEHAISVIYLGVDCDTFRPPAPAPRHRPVRILYAGTLDARKGVQYLLQAVAKYRLDAELVLVGAPGDLDLTAYRGLFTHLPSLPLSGLANAMRDVDIFAFPSLCEGSARVNFLAMATGLPVVTTRQAGSPIRDGHDGRLVNAGDVDALGSTLQELCDDPEQRTRLGRAARIRMTTEFTWADYAQRLMTLYARLLDAR